MAKMINPKKMAQNPSTTAINNVNKTKIKPADKPQKPIVRTMEEEYYMDMFTLKMTPISNDYLLKFALEWVDVVEADEEILTILDFPAMKRVHEGTLYDWIKRCPELKQAHSMVKSILASRRERGALNGKLDTGIVRQQQAWYTESWKGTEEWRNNMKIKIAESGGIKVVELPAYGSTDLVPTRKISKGRDDL